MRYFALIVAVIGALSFVPYTLAAVEGQGTVPLPKLDERPVSLRVVYAVNPRFSRMSPSQIHLMLSTAKSLAREHFGVTVNFSDVDQMYINTLLNIAPEVAVKAHMKYAYPFRYKTADPLMLETSIARALGDAGESLDDRITYARPYLVHPMTAQTPEALAEALTQTLLARLRPWTTVPAADGRPVIDDLPYNEWLVWNAVGYGDLSYELVLTNQLIASAEYYTDSVATALRGGITIGTTAYSRSSPYGAFIFFSTFPFTESFPPLVELRGGKSYSPREQALFAGAVLAHELGHLLLHLGHPLTKSECLMRPVPLLHLDTWYWKVADGDCPIGSTPAMRRGAAPIKYWKPTGGTG